MTAHTLNRTTAIACLILSMSLVGSYVALSKPLTLGITRFLAGVVTLWHRWIGDVALA